MKTIPKMAARAMALAAMLSVEALAAPSSAVTTRIDIPYGSGRIQATFVATPTGDGAWSVTAEFSPRGINYRSPCPFNPDPRCSIHISLRGTATTQFLAPSDTAITVTAQGLYFQFDREDPSPRDAHCGLTVAADGSVTVSSFWLDFPADFLTQSLAPEQASDPEQSEFDEINDSLSATENAGASGTVTTRLSIPYGSGQIRATFVATPTADGLWSVSAEFSPRGIRQLWPCIWCYPPQEPSRVELRGTATAQFTAASGATAATIVAQGLYWQFQHGDGLAMDMLCTLTVNADGSVTVSSIVLTWASPN